MLASYLHHKHWYVPNFEGNLHIPASFWKCLFCPVHWWAFL